MREKMRNKSIGEQTYLMMGKSSPQGPCKLAIGGRRSPGSRLGHHQLEREREIDVGVKGYSG
jgi:hypothetical protein